jgi:hypothetical protein
MTSSQGYRSHGTATASSDQHCPPYPVVSNWFPCELNVLSSHLRVFVVAAPAVHHCCPNPGARTDPALDVCEIDCCCSALGGWEYKRYTGARRNKNIPTFLESGHPALGTLARVLAASTAFSLFRSPTVSDSGVPRNMCVINIVSCLKSASVVSGTGEVGQERGEVPRELKLWADYF